MNIHVIESGSISPFGLFRTIYDKERKITMQLNCQGALANLSIDDFRTFG